MKYRTDWKIAIVVIICLAAFIGLAQAQETDESDKPYKGEVRFRYDWLGVNEDRGRFREDNWMTDRSTGGLDWLRLESKGPDENGYEYLIEGKALYDYDYDLSFLLRKLDSHYLKLDFSSDRRYFDGSNEYWDPSLAQYGNLSKRFAEKTDFDFFVDRRNYNIELGLTPPEGAQWTFGWHRLVKDGKEVLLQGGRARDAATARIYGIPAISNQRLITDTIYGEVSYTLDDKYNFRVRQEFEQHRGEQNIFREDYQNGSLVDAKNFLYHPGYTNWRTMFMFDSFLDEETYVTANYMYNYLNSDSTYSKFTDGVLGDRTRGTGNSKRTNVGALGYRKANAMNVPGLNFSAGIRVDDSKTSSQSNFGSGANPLWSSLDEVRVAESIRLVYKGIERTTLSFDADLEQRDLDWSARYPASVDNFDRDTDIDFQDQVYTLKAVHRFNRAVKSTVKFRIKDLERSYTALYDPHSDYPGLLGNYRRKGNDLTVKTDFRHNSKTNSTLMYQFVQESIDFSFGGKTSNMEIHRGLGSVSFSPKDNLFFVGTFMLENYDLDTPAIPSNNPVYGPLSSDYAGSSYTLMLDGAYAFNADTSCTLGVQHTEGLGQLSTENGAYVYDTVSLGLNHKLSANRTIGLGYQFYKFDNQARGSGRFDDYTAHSAFVTYTYTF